MKFKKIIVGLGNSGDEYLDTRHNIGFMAIDAISKKYGVLAKNEECGGSTRIVNINGNDVLLLKPHLFINNSGIYLKNILQKYRDISINDIIVINDDLDMLPGTSKFRELAKSNGHNGIKNIVAMLGATNFSQIQIGIGRPEDDNITEYVLSKPSSLEKILIDNTINNVVQGIEYLLDGKIVLSKEYLNSK